jgi:hypothetical protein
MLCEGCLEVVRECACCAGAEGSDCTCGFPICSRCAESQCAEYEDAPAVAGHAGSRW